MVIIDQELCVGCGACAKDCPGHAIRMEEGKAKVIRPCIQCGHCNSRCPFHVDQMARMKEIEQYFK